MTPEVGRGVAARSAEVVRDAMSFAAADAMLRGAAARDGDAEAEAIRFFTVHDETHAASRESARDRVPRAPRDVGAPAPPSDREAMLRSGEGAARGGGRTAPLTIARAAQ